MDPYVSAVFVPPLLEEECQRAKSRADHFGRRLEFSLAAAEKKMPAGLVHVSAIVAEMNREAAIQAELAQQEAERKAQEALGQRKAFILARMRESTERLMEPFREQAAVVRQIPGDVPSRYVIRASGSSVCRGMSRTRFCLRRKPR